MENDPVEIVDLPIENGGSFHRYVNVYQRVPFNHWEILIYWKSISQHPLSHFCLLSYIFRRLFNDWIATWLPELTYFGNPKEHLIFAKSLVFSQTVLWSTMVHWLVFLSPSNHLLPCRGCAKSLGCFLQRSSAWCWGLGLTGRQASLYLDLESTRKGKGVEMILPSGYLTWPWYRWPWYRWPIEIDGLPNLKMVDLSMAMLNNQMVSFFSHWLVLISYDRALWWSQLLFPIHTLLSSRGNVRTPGRPGIPSSRMLAE